MCLHGIEIAGLNSGNFCFVAIFEKFVDKESNKDEFYRLAYRLMGNKEDAEEVLQDTFLRAYQKIGSFEGKSKLSTWLYRICVNRCLNRRDGLKKFALTKTYD